MTNLWRFSVGLSVVFLTTTAAQKNMDQLSNTKSKFGRELIINGEQAPRGRYPYFSTLNHDCGGTLIAPDTLLTAGHCLPPHKHSVVPHVGRYTFHEDDTSKGYSIVAMERHPHWKGLGEDEFRYDVSLLFLNETIDTPYLRLNRDANLPTSGQQLTAMGVGWTSNDWEHARKANTLRRVHLEYLPNDQCELTNNERIIDDDEAITRYEGRIHHDHLCTTGGPNNERDACAYDSGSPIIIEGDDPEEDVLVALVSWGEGCADPDFPAVNTRISDLMDFLRASVCEHSVSPPAEFNCPGSSPSEEPTGAPTPLPSSENKTTIFSPLNLWFFFACVVAATLYWIRLRPLPKRPQGEEEEEGFLWLPYKGPYLERRQTSETEYLYQNSPASSRGSQTDYDAIQSMDV